MAEGGGGDCGCKKIALPEGTDYTLKKREEKTCKIKKGFNPLGERKRLDS